MHLYALNCPKCGANLSIENGIDSFYCQYCGHHIMLEGQSDEVVKEKIKLERDKLAYRRTSELWDKWHEEQKQIREQREEQKSKNVWILVLGLLVIAAIWFFL